MGCNPHLVGEPCDGFQSCPPWKFDEESFRTKISIITSKKPGFISATAHIEIENYYSYLGSVPCDRLLLPFVSCIIWLYPNIRHLTQYGLLQSRLFLSAR